MVASRALLSGGTVMTPDEWVLPTQFQPEVPAGFFLTSPPGTRGGAAYHVEENEGRGLSEPPCHNKNQPVRKEVLLKPEPSYPFSFTHPPGHMDAKGIAKDATKARPQCFSQIFKPSREGVSVMKAFRLRGFLRTQWSIKCGGGKA